MFIRDPVRIPFRGDLVFVEVSEVKGELVRSRQRRCSVKKGFLKIFIKFTGKHLCQSLFFNKVAGLRPATLLKKRLWHTCFPVSFAKFLGTTFLQKALGRLLLINLGTAPEISIVL